jgi:hypothetical protein
MCLLSRLRRLLLRPRPRLRLRAAPTPHASGGHIPRTPPLPAPAPRPVAVEARARAIRGTATPTAGVRRVREVRGARGCGGNRSLWGCFCDDSFTSSCTFSLSFCDDHDTFLFFLVSCDATMARWHPLSFSFSFSVLTTRTRCILYTPSLCFYIPNVSVPKTLVVAIASKYPVLYYHEYFLDMGAFEAREGREVKRGMAVRGS